MDSISPGAISDQWIDRDTYQKSFKYLSSSFRLKNVFYKNRKILVKARLSKKSSKAELTQFKIELINFNKEDQQEEVTQQYATKPSFSTDSSFHFAGYDLKNASDRLPFKALRIKLKDSISNEVIEQKKVPENMFIQTVPSKGEASETKLLPETPIVDTFSVPEGHKLKNLVIRIEGLVKEELEDKNLIEPEGVFLGSMPVSAK